MKKNWIATTTVAVGVLFAQSAMAQSQNFEGFYVQGAVGYENSAPSVDGGVLRSTGGTPTAGTYNPTISVSSKSFADYSLGLGFGFRIGAKTILSVGANLNPQSQDYDAKTSLPGYTVSPSTGSIKNRIQYFIAPGYEVDNNSLVYAKLGVASAKFESSSGDSANLNGIVYGVGYKTFFDKNLYFYGEFNATNLNKSTVSGSGVSYTGTYSYDASATSTQILVGVGYKF